MFEFEMRATEHHTLFHNSPQWDRAVGLTVKAETQSKAIEKAKVVLGDVGYRYGWPWVLVVDNIKEVV